MTMSNETIQVFIDKLNAIAIDYDYRSHSLMISTVREFLERAATQHCPQCEEKQRQIDELMVGEKTREWAETELSKAQDLAADISSDNTKLQARIKELERERDNWKYKALTNYRNAYKDMGWWHTTEEAEYQAAIAGLYHE